MATNKAGGVQGEGDYVSAKKFDDELNEQLEKLMADFKKQFQPTESAD